MIRIGLTGGIGMGKSTAATLLAEQGIRVVDTDQLARDVVAVGQPALAEIRAAFGAGVLAADGSLNREAMAALVFSDVGKRQQLEAILHPKIRERWLGCLAEWKAAGATAGVVVIPLLFETGAEAAFDRVLCVACSERSQMERLKARIAAQWPAQRKMDLSHGVVWTEPGREVHGEQLRRLLARWTA
jgi:dephospho-CoA kinase